MLVKLPAAKSALVMVPSRILALVTVPAAMVKLLVAPETLLVRSPPVVTLTHADPFVSQHLVGQRAAHGQEWCPVACYIGGGKSRR